MNANGIRPSLIALIVCDAIYEDPAGGKSALVGLFNNIRSSKFPAVHPQMAVFVSLTGVRSGMTGKLDIVDGATDEPIISAGGEFPEKTGPTDVLDMNFILRGVRFPKPGTYYIRFFGNEFPLAMRPFHVLQVSPPKAPDSPAEKTP